MESRVSFPSISIVTGSYNTPIGLWKKTLDAIREQEYPHSQVEHIIMDAGSSKKTLAFLKKYSTRVIVRKDLLEKPGVRMSIGIKKARGDLVLILEPDNILPSKNWLKQMVQPFIDHKDITGAFSIHNTYEPDMPLFTKYCALIGINDPLVFYLHKSEKLPRNKTRYTKGNILKQQKGYTLVSFTRQTLPTLGDNGHMVRRDLIMNVNKDPNTFLHTDAFALLASKGYARYAVVQNSIIHHTGSNIINFFKRRVEYKERLYDTLKSRRHYLVYNPNSPEDRKNLMLYILYSLTFIQPLGVSVRGFIAVPEFAWFLHPVVCFLGVFAYGYSEIRSTYYSLIRK